MYCGPIRASDKRKLKSISEVMPFGAPGRASLAFVAFKPSVSRFGEWAAETLAHFFASCVTNIHCNSGLQLSQP